VKTGNQSVKDDGFPRGKLSQARDDELHRTYVAVFVFDPIFHNSSIPLFHGEFPWLILIPKSLLSVAINPDILLRTWQEP
jgi:hypothetical protein